MRLPARALAGHLVWGRDGSVWAVYGVDPVCWPHLPTADKLAWHARLRAACMALPADSLLLGICRRVDPGEVVAAMIDGVDLAACPAWRAEAARTLDELLGVALVQRRHYLAVRLPDGGLRGAAGCLGAANSAVAERFGLPAAPLRAGEVAARSRQAELIEARLGALVDLRRVGGGELRWLYARAVARGDDEPYLDADWADGVRPLGAGDAARLAGPSLAVLADAVFYEGGAPDDPHRPAHRRYLRVDHAAGRGYQALLAVAELPREWLFPDGAGEWFYQLDQLGFPIDWCARVTAVANAQAQARARRQARQLAGQFDEYDGEATGAPADLAEAARGVDDEQAELAANTAEPELQATVVFAVAAGDLAVLEARAGQLQSLFSPVGYGLARPTGGQLALFTSMLPGSPLPAVARDYTQHLLARDLAAGMPFAGHQVGDRRGMLLGVSLDGSQVAADGLPALVTPVLWDPASGPGARRSGSIGMTGNLGSGKSYLLKRVMHAVLARGGQVVAIDRTRMGEYEAFAAAAPGRAQVVRLAADAPVCLDPLGLFDGEERVGVTVSFLCLLCQISPASLEGAALDEAVRAVAARTGGALGDVPGELQAAADADPDARAVARKLAVYARNRLAGLVFDRAQRPLLELDADYLCFHTPGLALPSREQLLTEHLARQLLPEQLLSQALLYLLAAIARTVVLGDRGRFGALVLDEAWALTSSQQGRGLILDLVRDGRKHNAAVWLASQHPADLGDDELSDLLGARFAFRQNAGAAPAAARVLGLQPTPALIQLLDGDNPQGLGSGQCLYRDSAGRVGKLQVLAAAPQLDAACDTNPARVAVGRAAGDPPAPDWSDPPAAESTVRLAGEARLA